MHNAVNNPTDLAQGPSPPTSAQHPGPEWSRAPEDDVGEAAEEGGRAVSRAGAAEITEDTLPPVQG